MCKESSTPISLRALYESYNVPKKEQAEIQEVMKRTFKRIQVDAIDGLRSEFEHDIANIVRKTAEPYISPDNWHPAEEFAQAFYEEGKWEDVFESFYGHDQKFKAYLEDVKRRRGEI